MKFPEKAKKVFDGTIFDVYQWEQEMFDGSKTTFEGLKRPGTILIIPLVGDKLILSKEEQPGTRKRDTYLGGRQEDGEEPIETAKRELLEEAGMESSDWELIREYTPHGKIDWTIYLFVARDCKKVAEQNLDAGERIELNQVSFEESIDIISRRDFWDRESSNDVYRMKHDGELEAYKKQIFGE